MKDGKYETKNTHRISIKGERRRNRKKINKERRRKGKKDVVKDKERTQ